MIKYLKRKQCLNDFSNKVFFFFFFLVKEFNLNQFKKWNHSNFSSCLSLLFSQFKSLSRMLHLAILTQICGLETVCYFDVVVVIDFSFNITTIFSQIVTLGVVFAIKRPFGGPNLPSNSNGADVKVGKRLSKFFFFWQTILRIKISFSFLLFFFCFIVFQSLVLIPIKTFSIRFVFFFFNSA